MRNFKAGYLMRISLELSAGSRSREPEPGVQTGPQSQAKPGTRTEVAILVAAIKQDKQFKSGRTWQVRLVKVHNHLSSFPQYILIEQLLLCPWYCTRIEKQKNKQNHSP